jgi:hypothetical protein
MSPRGANNHRWWCPERITTETTGAARRRAPFPLPEFPDKL